LQLKEGQTELGAGGLLLLLLLLLVLFDAP
jgi:hypothetical protein